MTLEIELYWSFRSPYSYLATPRLRALERDWDVRIDVRPVLPLAVREPDFFAKVNPLWPGYLLRDVVRIAQYEGMAIAWPSPDPVVQEGASRKIAADQPHAHRLTRLGTLAAEKGRGLPFLFEVSHLLWGGKVKGWHEGTHLAEATARAGLDLASLESESRAREPELDARIASHQKSLESAGHWGVPTTVFRGEPFFGQDRLDLLEWRLKQAGLTKRVT
jgi:2-hydroxychromene-2-carboxylate isomerase